MLLFCLNVVALAFNLITMAGDKWAQWSLPAFLAGMSLMICFDYLMGARK